MRLAVAITMIALMGVGALASIASVGKPRRPLTGGQAAYVTLMMALEILGVLYLSASAS